MKHHPCKLFCGAGRLHVNVNGKPVVPGGHRLVAAPCETSRLAFVAAYVTVRAGEKCSTLLQLQDSHGHNIQANPLADPSLIPYLLSSNLKYVAPCFHST